MYVLKDYPDACCIRANTLVIFCLGLLDRRLTPRRTYCPQHEGAVDGLDRQKFVSESQMPVSMQHKRPVAFLDPMPHLLPATGPPASAQS
jgi:hypothetical protein